MKRSVKAQKWAENKQLITCKQEGIERPRGSLSKGLESHYYMLSWARWVCSVAQTRAI
jgi:hypothetical protein